jgi:hypothetical protein
MNGSKVSKGGSKGTREKIEAKKARERKERRKEREERAEGTGAGQNMADKNFNGVQEFAFSQKNVSSQVRGQLFKWYFQFHLSHISLGMLITGYFFLLNFVSQFLRSNFLLVFAL